VSLDLLDGLLRATGRGHAGEDPESRRARIGCTLLAIGGLSLLLGLFMAQKDLRLRLFGIRVQAVVTEVGQLKDRRGGPTGQLLVRYHFEDRSGQPHESCDRVDQPFDRGVGDQVEVLYFGDRPATSKLAANTGLWYLFLAGLGLAILAVPVAALFQGARLPAGRGGRTGRA
jgi:hypothetical protein